jgi:hypothetical protein
MRVAQWIFEGGEWFEDGLILLLYYRCEIWF